MNKGEFIDANCTETYKTKEEISNWIINQYWLKKGSVSADNSAHHLAVSQQMKLKYGNIHKQHNTCKIEVKSQADQYKSAAFQYMQ